MNRYHCISYIDELVEYVKTFNFIINMDLILGLSKEKRRFLYTV
ncbi:hypothetical protein HMPREF1987_00586 [Peptostreptococcaceae bacterium oral taxon 113 str. W5053]|nr:hypothetical protein HMPREF1987_00586 [Peptostreptococcaceae bacterium oral taxon 113 str. W5053]